MIHSICQNKCKLLIICWTWQKQIAYICIFRCNLLYLHPNIMIGLLNINPDILILAAPIFIVALWGISFLLVLLRKWKSAFVILLLSIVLNVWKEQIPINFIKIFYNPSSTEIITNKPKNEIPDRAVLHILLSHKYYTPIHGLHFLVYSW